MGDKEEPCGTPLVRGRDSDGGLLGITTYWERPVRKDWNQLRELEEKEIFLSLVRRMLWSTESKALEKSRRIRMVSFC